MFAELPLSTSIPLVLKSAIDKLISKALSRGWCSCLASFFVKLMARLSTLVASDNFLEIWMLCTTCKYVFLPILEDPAIVLPPMITLISLSASLGLSLARQLGSGSLGGCSSPLMNCYSFPYLIRALICCLRS